MTTIHYFATVPGRQSGPHDRRHDATGMHDPLRAFCELCPLPDCVRKEGDLTGVIEYPDCLISRIKINRGRR